MFLTAKFPHGNGRNPFVWAHGDPTGYGLHGDFLNGWDTGIHYLCNYDKFILRDK